MLAEQLKHDTLESHQALEKILITKIRAIRSTNDYINLLQLFYTYFGGLEKQMSTMLVSDILPDYHDRRKAASLAEDITALGATPAELAATGSLPVLGSVPAALGALYVIEGSTLGGQVISRMIAGQLTLPEQLGLSFFTGYGAETQPMWQKFKNSINGLALTPEEALAMIDAARETFVKFKKWMDSHG
ncbi:biliverdin-producing heme oxygenase [Mucilaginibacter paludis]|uniref:Heme oxygenase-like protein n=1 Tax=Mucilaginibacter paludis DSM 18603 TaxID=714943 RepID=H1Y751_9SPHI|nr:biliverdin-producing heme oxygenase [Mucilaginibacter paludis]EHQ28670.1 Heme oxygenase-like protein [Mucilaginibacter paludis DSM 18603]